jgi:hypothetical protein
VPATGLEAVSAEDVLDPEEQTEKGRSAFGIQVVEQQLPRLLLQPLEPALLGHERLDPWLEAREPPFDLA